MRLPPDRPPGTMSRSRQIAMMAVRRSTGARRQTWLAENWPAAIWLVAASSVIVALARTMPEAYRQLVDMTDLPEQERVQMRSALTDLRLSPVFLAQWEVMIFGVVG